MIRLWYIPNLRVKQLYHFDVSNTFLYPIIHDVSRFFVLKFASSLHVLTYLLAIPPKETGTPTPFSTVKLQDLATAQFSDRAAADVFHSLRSRKTVAGPEILGQWIWLMGDRW